jgi:hypothetical protein
MRRHGASVEPGWCVNLTRHRGRSGSPASRFDTSSLDYVVT